MKYKINKKHFIFSSVTLVFAIILIYLFFPKIAEFFIVLAIRIILFLKVHLLPLILGFFLINGKFVLKLFLKKMLLMLPIGLLKRFFIEEVVGKNVKNHYLKELPLKEFFVHVKSNFLQYTLVKKLIALMTILTTTILSAKYFGWLIFLKTMFAKLWSWLLVLTLTSFKAIGYFFGTYIWNSWLTPLIEILILSWLLSFLEKYQWIKRRLSKVYKWFYKGYIKVDRFLCKTFHIPVRKRLSKYAKTTKTWMYDFMGVTIPKQSIYKRIISEKLPSIYMQMKKNKKGSFYIKLKSKKREYKRKKPLKESI